MKKEMSNSTLTVQEFAEALNKSQRTIRRWLKGQTGVVILFDTWRAYDTNPDGERRVWLFERLGQSVAA